MGYISRAGTRNNAPPTMQKYNVTYSFYCFKFASLLIKEYAL